MKQDKKTINIVEPSFWKHQGKWLLIGAAICLVMIMTLKLASARVADVSRYHTTTQWQDVNNEETYKQTTLKTLPAKLGGTATASINLKIMPNPAMKEMTRPKNLKEYYAQKHRRQNPGKRGAVQLAGRESACQMWGFGNGETAEIMTNAFRNYYNFIKPHSSLEGLTPAEKAGIGVENSENKWQELLKRSLNHPQRTDEAETAQITL